MRLKSRNNKDGSTSFYIDYRLNGQRRRETLKNVRDRKTAEIAFADFQLRIARGQVGLSTNEKLTLHACLKQYVAAKKPSLADKSFKVLLARAREMLAFFGKNSHVARLTEARVNQYREHLREQGQTPFTINTKVGVLKAAVRRAVREHQIETDPLQGIENLSDPRPEKWRFLTTEEARALLSVLRDGVTVKVSSPRSREYTRTVGQNTRLYRLVVFLLNTGARCGEALALRWRDVDLEDGMVTLNTTKAASRGRRAKPRHIPINEALRPVLREMNKERTGEKVFHYPNNLPRDFRRACDLAGIGHCRVHDLRHTFASGLVRNGVPLNTVRELLGHKTMAMTLRYAHLAPDTTAKAVSTLDFGVGDAGAARVVEVKQDVG